MTKMIAITFALLLGACTGGPLQTADGGTPETGIYNLRMGTATGNCSPPNLSGPLELPQMYVGAPRPGIVTLMIPDSIQPGLTSYSQLDLVAGKWDNTLDTCGATHELRVVLGETSTNELTATRTDVWSNTAAATHELGCAVPTADCTTSVDLHYALAEACAPPCVVKDSPTPSAQSLSFVCACPDGGAP
jgi:hypothetical protein